jgi:hypothetical protein
MSICYVLWSAKQGLNRLTVQKGPEKKTVGKGRKGVYITHNDNVQGLRVLSCEYIYRLQILQIAKVCVDYFVLQRPRDAFVAWQQTDTYA